MDSTLPTKRHSAVARTRRVHRHPLGASWVIPLLLVGTGFVVLLPAAMLSPLYALAAICSMSVILLVATVGADRASTVLTVLAFGFAPLASLAIGPRPFVLASALFALAFGLALPRLMYQPLRLPPVFVVGSVLFGVMGLVAAPLAINSGVSIIYLATAIIALVLIPIAVAWMSPTDRQMFAMALAFGVGTAISTLIGLPRHEFRNSGFTYHPVALAYTAMLTLSLVPYLLSTKERGRWIVVPPVAVVALIGVWTSGSRTSLIVLAALVLLIPLMERSIALGLAVAGGIAIALPFLSSFTPGSGSTSALARLLGTGGAKGSDAVREATLRDGWEQVQSSPLFGNGYSIERTYVIHNVYLQVSAAEGVIGLLGLLLMLGALCVPAVKASSPRRCLAYPALAVVLAGPFQPNMGDHYLGLALGLALVAAVGVRNNIGIRAGPPDEQERACSSAPQVNL